MCTIPQRDHRDTDPGCLTHPCSPGALQRRHPPPINPPNKRKPRAACLWRPREAPEHEGEQPTMLSPTRPDEQEADDRPSLHECIGHWRSRWSDRSPAHLSPRFWLYGQHYLMGAVSATVADGGTGKSTLALTEAIAIVTNLTCSGIAPDVEMHNGERVRRTVLYWNGEEPRAGDRPARVCDLPTAQHQPRRVRREIEGFVGSRRLSDHPRQDGTWRNRFDEHVVGELADADFDLITLDPFVACHRVSENDNMAIDANGQEMRPDASGGSGGPQSRRTGTSCTKTDAGGAR